MLEWACRVGDDGNVDAVVSLAVVGVDDGILLVSLLFVSCNSIVGIESSVVFCIFVGGSFCSISRANA